MPSAEHEAPLELAKLDPTLIAWLLANVFDVKVPDYHHTRTYPMDGVLLFCDLADRPGLGAVLEVQRGWDKAKRRTWKLYLAQAEAELDVDVALLVYCPDHGTAQRYRDLFAVDGLSLSLRPLIFTLDDVPLISDVDLARANPALAVLSAISHGDDADVDAMFPALDDALHAVGPRKAISHRDVLLAGLPEATRARWEAFMDTTPDRAELVDETLRRLIVQDRNLGESDGWARARALLLVLYGRGVWVPDDARDQIFNCTDIATFNRWLIRAGRATTIEDVIGR
jgi:hypothetical protein